jgi:hypothetical protein
MNKNIIKGIIIFATGFGIGVIATKKRLENQYEQLVQDEIASIREASVLRRVPKRDDSDEEDTDKVLQFGSHTMNAEAKKMKVKMEKIVTNYGGYYSAQNAMADPEDMITPEDDQTDKENCESMSRAANDKHGSNPYVISMDDYDNTNPHYDKISIAWYNDDAVLADENEQPVDDVALLVGRCLEMFGHKSGDPDVVYVRNENLGIDYEVIAHHTSYKSAVLGED